MSTLPPEILVSILAYLAPDDLGRVSGTCRVLYLYSIDDRLWRHHVQENVPGQQITSPHPYASFRELYSAHDPHWFLPKYKFWFSDSGLPGRIIMTRYNPREGSIEGFQLLCQNINTSFHTWHAPGPSIVSGFSPSLYLYYQIPALRLPGRPPHTDTVDAHQSEPSSSKQSNGFRSEIFMAPAPLANYKSSFTYARSLSPSDLTTSTSPVFPHNHVWPSPHIASGHRVLGAGLSQPMALRPEDRARSRREVCEKAFRIHKWLPKHHLEEYPSMCMSLHLLFSTHPIHSTHPSNTTPTPRRPSLKLANQPSPISAVEPGSLASHFVSAQGGGSSGNAMRRNRASPAPACIKLGEEVATYTTLDPAQYTPTPTKPFRGIFVGDYGGHGCEFVWIHQPDDDTPPPTVERREGEPDADYAARQREAAVYRGRLEAVKLTGDANVPRGEHTFVVDDLGEAGFVREETKDPFTGARVVRSKGHIANNGFRDGELFLFGLS